MNKAILITAAGDDQPGITARLTELISQNQGEILDIGQSVINGFLSLSILVTMNQGRELLKDILFEGKKMGLAIDFRVIDLKEKEQNEDRHSYIISCVSPIAIEAKYISGFANVLAAHDLNIQQINKTSDNMNSFDIICTSRHAISWEDIKAKLIGISTEYKVDID